jgi:hypothetical protein
MLRAREWDRNRIVNLSDGVFAIASELHCWVPRMRALERRKDRVSEMVCAWSACQKSQ